LLSLVCLTYHWYYACADLLFDTLVHPLFGSGWEISMFRTISAIFLMNVSTPQFTATTTKHRIQVTLHIMFIFPGSHQ
jgi:hypothetical protein